MKKSLFLSLFVALPSFSFNFINKKNLYIEPFVYFFAGQLQGERSIITKPYLVPGVKGSYSKDRFLIDFETKAFYGTADTGSGNKTNQLMQLNTKLDTIYKFFDGSDYYTGFGMFFRGYTPLSKYKPYINLSQIKTYAPEENEVSDENFTLGIGPKASATNKRLYSDVDLIIYLAGTRVAPNLIPYSPLLSVDWKNKMFLIGTSYNPKLDIMLDGIFYFERKYQATLITQHDGLAGAKREFDIKVGLEYY